MRDVPKGPVPPAPRPFDALLPRRREGPPTEDDLAWERYLAACTDYLKRQMIVYQNWPQRKVGRLGYTDEKVFDDQNA
ncbi:MAG TPA: hypothetical protein VM889_13870 [Candidatus Thermoplasmatota archaeon]|nr:hypothetical protein [Candidatus Thermoplasmatota archaeon]